MSILQWLKPRKTRNTTPDIIDEDAPEDETASGQPDSIASEMGKSESDREKADSDGKITQPPKKKKTRNIVSTWYRDFPWADFREDRIFCKLCSSVASTSSNAVGKRLALNQFVKNGATNLQK